MYIRHLPALLTGFNGMQMLPRALIIICITLSHCQQAHAASSTLIWDVLPGECVVSKNQEYCDTTLSVTLLATSFINPCVYVDQRWVGCFEPNNAVLHFPIIIDSDVKVTLADDNRKTLARYTIEYRLMQSTPQRRRVRLPWSVF